MFWRKKKKGMVDIREFHKRGVRIPEGDVMVTTNKDGFVEMGGGAGGESESMPEPKTMFSFFDKPAAVASVSSSVSEGADFRKLTERIERLDNMLYKLEQRIELLERKAGVGGSDGGVSTGALIGW